MKGVLLMWWKGIYFMNEIKKVVIEEDLGVDCIRILWLRKFFVRKENGRIV